MKCETLESELLLRNPITAALWQLLVWLATWMLSCIEQSSFSDVQASSSLTTLASQTELAHLWRLNMALLSPMASNNLLSAWKYQFSKCLVHTQSVELAPTYPWSLWPAQPISSTGEGLWEAKDTNVILCIRLQPAATHVHTIGFG